MAGFGFIDLGFQLAIPSNVLDGEEHRLEVRDQHRRIVPIVITGQHAPYVDFRSRPIPKVSSYVDGFRHGAFEGWVVRSDAINPEWTGNCVVRVTCDGLTIGHVRASRTRVDVARALNGPPHCGFRFTPPESVYSGKPRTFGFHLMPDDIELWKSPVVVTLVDDEMKSRLHSLIASVDVMHREMTKLRRQLHEMAPGPHYNLADYDRWFRVYEPTLRRRVLAQRPADGWAAGPLVSIICPVYRPALSDFNAAVASVRAQTYRNFELILVDDNSRDTELSAVLDRVANEDSRIKVIRNKRNLGISGATNAGLALASGEYVAFFDHDDLLVDVAIECMVGAALQTGADMLYSDEDKVDSGGTFQLPALKPDWNYRLMLGVNYVCHLLFVKRSTTLKAGPLDSKYDGAQDHEYTLRLSEHVAHSAIHHVPEMLYHWRLTPGSTSETVANKGYAVDAGAQAVMDHLVRTHRTAEVEAIDGQTHYHQRWLVSDWPAVTIIIPYKDEIATTERCLQKVLNNTDYSNFDVILVDNWSTSFEASSFAKRVKKNAQVRILRMEENFNYSRLNNVAATMTDAPFLVLMNNDLFVENKDWLKIVVAEAVVDPQVAAVGGKFLYPNETVQHGGVVTGLGGVAGHIFVGDPLDSHGYANRMLFAQEMSAVTAAGMLVRRSAFDEVGGLDERDLKVAFNDVDLCMKLRQAGYKIIWTPDFVAAHHESLSRGDDERPMQETRFFDETQVMRERWGPVLDRDPFYHPKFLLDRQPFFDLVDPEA